MTINNSSTQAVASSTRAAPGSGPLVLATNNLTRSFGSGEQRVIAVNQANLEVRAGEFLSLVGRSGSGKTTLLNLLAGLDQPTSGTVYFEGQDLGKFSERDLLELRRRKISFVFQSFGLIPLLSAYENVELPLHISGVSWRERRRRALEALELVGLEPRSGHRPYELSGGEQQRVAIARALVTGPDVLFADEPTGELDSITGLSIAGIMRDIAQERGVTIVVATHDLALASLSGRTVEIADGVLQG